MADFAAQRQQVVETCHVLSEKGFLAGTGGNVAMRLDADHFAVTPSATDYATMGVEDIAVLRFDTLEQVMGTRPASVERGLHAAMLRARPERPASVHTHQPVASAVAILHETLAWPDGFDRELLGDHVALVPYRPSGTGMLVKSLARSLRPKVHVYLLASHGVICAAPDLEAAVAMVAAIEAAAAFHLLQMTERHPIRDGQLRDLVQNALGAAQKKDFAL